MVKELEQDPPCFWSMIRALDTVQDGLNAMQIPHTLDVDVIANAVYGGQYTWMSSMRLMQQIWNWIEKEEPLSGVVMGTGEMQPGHVFVNVFKIVMAKFKAVGYARKDENLKLMGPMMALHGIKHEQDKFHAKLRSNLLTLEKTTLWLKTHEWRVEVGMVSLLVEEQRIIPETLLLDRDHFHEMHLSFWKAVMNASVKLAKDEKHKQHLLSKKEDPLNQLM